MAANKQRIQWIVGNKVFEKAEKKWQNEVRGKQAECFCRLPEYNSRGAPLAYHHILFACQHKWDSMIWKQQLLSYSFRPMRCDLLTSGDFCVMFGFNLSHSVSALYQHQVTHTRHNSTGIKHVVSPSFLMGALLFCPCQIHTSKCAGRGRT